LLLLIKYYSDYQTEEVELGGASYIHRSEVKAYKIVVGNPDGKRHLGEGGRTILICLKEVERDRSV
jgi:hypothetical protein